MNFMTRYLWLMVWVVVAPQYLQAQNWQNPYQERFNRQFAAKNYEQAEIDFKNGKPVKVLVLNEFTKPLDAPLAQLVDVEQVFVQISRSDSVKMAALFDELSRLPKLKYLSISGNIIKPGDTLKIPANVAKLKGLEGLSLKMIGSLDLSAVWPVLPNFKQLAALDIELPSKQMGLPLALGECKNLKSLKISSFEGQLPDGLAELKTLEYITLQGKYYENKVQPLLTYPKTLSEFASLKGLEISNFRFNGADFKGLSDSLQHLSVNSCTLSEPDELINALNRCQRLESFYLRMSTLPSFSAAIKIAFPNLKELIFWNLSEDSLRKNPLSSMPDFSKSIGLKVLQLERVLGEDLPKGIERMTELETLNLAENRLTQLPDLGKLTKLRNLIVNNNQLKELPNDIGKALKLRILNVENNQLAELPSGLVNAVELEMAFLADNNLIRLPAEFSKCKKLKELNARGNKLTELPKNIGSWVSLQNLQLNNNELTELPNSIGQLKRLRALDVSHNPFSKLPETLGDCDSLEMLMLSNCRLEALPHSLGKLQHLTFLNLADADAVYFNRNINSRALDQVPAKNHNQLRSLPASLANCRKLVNLDLSRNKYWEEKDLWLVIQQLRMPQGTVNLTECNLSAVPMTGWLDTQIQSLHLVKNELKQFPTEWYKAKGIKSIVLFRNKLTPPSMNQEFRSFEERLLLGDEMGVELPKPFPKTKEMARAYLNQAGKKVNMGDIPRFVEYMKEVQRIDSTEGKYAVELWSRFYFHTHQYRRAIDSMNVVIERYFKYDKELQKSLGQQTQRGLPVALYIDLRGQSKWKLGDSLGAIKDYELLVNDYKLFAPNLWGRLGVWYKSYSPTTGKSGAAFDKALNMYEAVRNPPPMVQLSAAEVYLMNEQPDKAYEYLFGLDRTKFRSEENRLADYLLLAAQVAQKQASEEEVETFEKRLKTEKIKIQGWSYQLFEEALESLDYPTEQKALIRRLTASLKAQSVLVD